MNNKNISVWRGDNTPPTQYHLWLKNDGKLYVNIDEQWQEIDKDSISQITEILNQHAAKLDNHQTALDDINTLHSKLWTPGKGNWSIMSQGVKDSIGEDLTKGALGPYSYAEGYKTTAAGDASHAEGFLSRATAIHAHAEGFDSEAGGEKSHAEGYQTVTSAVGSHAEGFQTQATNAYSHAEGNATIADGQSSHAEGVNSYASNEGAHVEGNSIASGLFSHSENKGTASGAFSHAEGNSSASGDYSHAEGRGCKTEDNPKGESKFGSYCHVEGIGTICISKGGHTEGNGTYVAGDFAHAEGISSRADGTASHAEGKNTIANGDSAHAQGRFNVGSKYYIHSTGIGNENERKNAECIYVNTDNVADPRNGYTYIYGIGDYDGINTDVTTYKSLQEVISDIDSTLTVKADLVNGKIPLEQLGNLDMVLFEVVRELPTTNIKKHIYLMKVSELESGAKNLYAEYIYTGDITATYDASKWEKLGVKQIETDLSDYYTKEETDNQIQIAKNSAINIHNEDNTKSIKLDINDTEFAEDYGSTVNASLIDHANGGIAIINAVDGFRHIDGNGDVSNLYSYGLYIENKTYSTSICSDHINMYNSDVNGDIEITTNKELTQEEQDDGYSPVNISLTDNYGNVNISATNGFTLKNKNELMSTFSVSGLSVRDANCSSSILSRGIYTAVGGRIAINLTTYGNECSIIFGTGYDNKFKMSCPIDNTEGGVISGIKSLTAFANPSATKVWATNGSTVDLTTKANVADLATKANASDVLLKKSASGGYYIEENSNELGEKAFAANSWCTASGMRSHAEGFSTASGMYSHAEGYGTIASGYSSHVEGSGTASGDNSHAEGYGTASGMYSHAEGESTASGDYSHAEGSQTIALGPFSHAQGICNIENENAIHSVGIGDDTTRKNAEYIYVEVNEDSSGFVDNPKNGYKYLIGVGGYDGISTDNSTYKSVQEVIADLTARIEQLEKLTANCVSISNVDEQTN